MDLINNPAVLKASEIFVKLKEKGLVVNENDIQIAAAAMISNSKLYTKDRDFLNIKKCFPNFKVQLVD